MSGSRRVNANHCPTCTCESTMKIMGSIDPNWSPDELSPRAREAYDEITEKIKKMKEEFYRDR